MTTDQIKNQLEDYYRKNFPHYQDAHVSGLFPMNEGWESIIYAYKLFPDKSMGMQPQNLILRIYPGTDAFHKSQQEFTGLQTLYQSGYPVPRVYHLERDHSPFDGRPFLIMEHIDGQMMWPVLERAQPDQAAQIITQFCELFVRLHNLDWRDFVPITEQENYQIPFFAVDKFFAMLRRETDYFPSLNVLSPILEWLEMRRNSVPCTSPAPVHWDFHPGNIIMKSDGDAVVIDWTQIQVSDPRFDLGWTLLLTKAYVSDEVGEMILMEYQRIAGAPIDELAFFDVASCLKRLGTVMISLTAGADSMGMRPDAADMMRSDFPALRKVNDLMVDRTGIQVLEIQKLLDS